MTKNLGMTNLQWNNHNIDNHTCKQVVNHIDSTENHYIYTYLL